MHKLPITVTILLLALIVSTKLVSAQTASPSPSPSPSGGTLPQTGIETPFLLLSGGGAALFSSGFLLKKLQRS